MDKKRLGILIVTICLYFPVFVFAETITLKSGKIVEADEIKNINTMEISSKEDGIQVGKHLFGFTKLPESINNINVSGKTTCSIQLIQDILKYIIPFFKVKTKEDVNFISFEYIDGKQIGEEFVFQEKWIAKSSSFECKYRVELKNNPGSAYGTDFNIEEILDK